MAPGNSPVAICLDSRENASKDRLDPALDPCRNRGGDRLRREPGGRDRGGGSELGPLVPEPLGEVGIEDAGLAFNIEEASIVATQKSVRMADRIRFYFLRISA
ncbi:hypothetical protein ACCD06_15620 [Azospirillum sp. CT11-132]|uniref:hypothetical protein n=1 Tax=Azospirillum sp. CT11-132 TaxID=3396317 RepID=UPI0039A580FB